MSSLSHWSIANKFNLKWKRKKSDFYAYADITESQFPCKITSIKKLSLVFVLFASFQLSIESRAFVHFDRFRSTQSGERMVNAHQCFHLAWSFHCFAFSFLSSKQHLIHFWLTLAFPLQCVLVAFFGRSILIFCSHFRAAQCSECKMSQNEIIER